MFLAPTLTATLTRTLTRTLALAHDPDHTSNPDPNPAKVSAATRWLIEAAGEEDPAKREAAIGA